MLSVAICDDEAEIVSELSRLVKKRFPDCETECFLSGEEMLSQNRKYDIIFLDIKMKKLNGIETAEALRERGCKSVIIFVSGLKSYVFNAFDVGAFNYILKPVDEVKFFKVLDRAVKEIGEAPERRRLLIKTKERGISIDADEIIYLENEMRKIAVHTLSDTLTFYGAMTDIEQQLGEAFFRCHRGYLVNMAFVAEYSSSEITLTNGDKVYIAKGRYNEFIKSYHRFLRGKGASL